MEFTLHPHPRHPEKKIPGCRLRPGKVFEVGDIYSHPDGWKKLPDSFAGAAVPGKSERIFVRPAVEEGQVAESLNASSAT